MASATGLALEQTIQKQTVLIGKQAELIHKLAALIDHHNMGHLLDFINPADEEITSDSKGNLHKSCGPYSYGPGSDAVKWTGNVFDILPVSIANKSHKAFIFDEETIGFWNRLLDLRRKIKKYKEEHKVEFDLVAECHARINNIDELQLANKGTAATSTERNEHAETLKAAHSRAQLLFDSILKFTYTKRMLNLKLARGIRKAMIQSDLRIAEGTGWIEDLRKSKIAFYGNVDIFDARFQDEEDNVPARWEPLELGESPKFSPKDKPNGAPNGSVQDSNTEGSEKSTA
ncbi:uncharacterized protein LY89DRAFT_666386 [Mollisia scopiformis]|uniref:Uncharacterized protein n=1 Tax=Mollisia scopiformis TaxID=149040 RepID=A0A194XKX6_MOLSC|nr:uncharacterized protein LY89DRAFT_666386 [Mollisia scopiformis]KUJ20749.1 hypothetical protein LY89DRAFT_666386 [Mollisia scopiformis]